jgi:hypothetical protein
MAVAIPSPPLKESKINQRPANYPTPQRLGKTFLAGTATDLPCPLARHPNASGAVGPKQYAVYSYAGGRVFDKKTAKIDPFFDVQVMTFFPPGGVDQRIKYDRFTGRWFLTAGDLQGIPNLEISSAGTLNVAVSDSGELSASTKWQVFIIPGDQVFPPGDFRAFELDFNNPGIDQHALYIGVDALDVDGNTIGATAYVIEKSSLLAGTPFITAFRDLMPATANPCGVDNFSKNPRYGYFLGIPASSLQLPGVNHVYHLLRVSNPGSTDRQNPPTLTSPIELEIGQAQVAYSFSAPQPDNFLGVNGTIGGGYTPATAHARNNQLYFALNVPVDRFGVSGNGLEDRDAIRWFQFDLKAGKKERATTIPTRVQAGQLFDPTDTPTPLYYMWPGLMTNKRNDLVLSFITASRNSYINAYFAGRLGSQPPDGTLGTPVLFYESKASYNAYLELASGFVPNLPNPPILNIAANRFGDGVYTTLDPNDELTCSKRVGPCGGRNPASEEKNRSSLSLIANSEDIMHFLLAASE